MSDQFAKIVRETNHRRVFRRQNRRKHRVGVSASDSFSALAGFFPAEEGEPNHNGYRNMENTREPNDVVQRLIQDLQGIVEPSQIQAIVNAIGELGYKIVLPEQSQQFLQGQGTVPKISTIGNSVSELFRHWQSRNPSETEWSQPQSYAYLAKRFIDLGVPYSAREVAEAGLLHASGQSRLELTQLLGLALGRCGLVDDASRVLSDPELALLPCNEEMRGLEAALQKQLGLRASNPDTRSRHLRASLALYRAAWKATDGTFWTGINVASLHLLLGDHAQAAAIAKPIETDCLAEQQRLQNQENSDLYWLWATLGEAMLNQGKLEEAEAWYRNAAGIARDRVGHLNSSRRQLRCLLKAIGQAESLVDTWLPIPGVAIFVGHRIDSQSRADERFAPEREANVKEAIMKWLTQNQVRSCVCSAANGSDILFLESLQSFDGSDTRIVLPFPEDKFIEESVKNGADESWVPRFREVLRRASRVTIASSERLGSDDQPYEYANRIIVGQGRILANELQTSLSALAVWNGNRNGAVGGTAMMVDGLLHQGVPVYAINPSDHATDLCARAVVQPSNSSFATNKGIGPGTSESATPSMQLKAMLFADVEGFSKLPDLEVKLFIEHFLGRVASCLTRHAPEHLNAPQSWHGIPIIVRETWGDGLYFVFNEIKTAGIFALDLCRLVRQTKWREELGFSHELKIRIALHAGPVHLSIDPITGLPKCTGTHVSRAARLEPKTPPNHVYASDAFASLASEEGIAEFRCEFVKLLDWAKHFGTYPTYVVTRNGEQP
jgi:class 3 adenylate cyclase/tetratricopeptide (TPR) repeat protein